MILAAGIVAEQTDNPTAELSAHGVEKISETGRLCRLNSRCLVFGMVGFRPGLSTLAIDALRLAPVKCSMGFPDAR